MQKRLRQNLEESPKGVAKKSRSRVSIPPSDENADATSTSHKLKKTIYFFKPTNTLKGNPAAVSKTCASTVLAATNANNHQSVIQSSKPIRTPSKSSAGHDLLPSDHHSSDDSFDGVRWKESPRKPSSKDLNLIPVLSSPLKKVSLDVSTSVNPNNSTVINEQTDSVLSKYGYGANQTLIQTPNLNRTHSDSSSSRALRSQKLLEKSPSLHRAKSAAEGSGGNNLHDPFVISTHSRAFEEDGPIKSSNLNSWIDKFDMSGSLEPKNEGFKVPHVTGGELALTKPIQVNNDLHKHIKKDVNPEENKENVSVHAVPGVQVDNILEGIDFDDDFTDSEIVDAPSSPKESTSNKVNPLPEQESHIGNILEKPSTKDPSNTGSPTASTIGALKAKKPTVEEDSDDPFSDDDDDIISILKTQAPTNVHNDKYDGNPNEIKKPKAADQNTDSDPFSDDDLEGLPTGKTPPIQDIAELDISKSGSLTTQQFADLKHAKSFQDGIKRTEFLKSNDNFLSNLPDENGAKLSFNRSDFKRYQIMGILKSSYKLKDRQKPQIILSVRDSNLQETKVMVRGDYTNLQFEVGDIIHIIFTNSGNQRLVDDSHNLLIWNPDTLVAATTVSQQIRCPRKTVINSKFKFPGESAIHFIIGYIIHEIFQECFVQENYNVEFMKEVLNLLLETRKLEIFSVGDEIETVKKAVLGQIPFIESWFKRYYKKAPTLMPTNKYKQDVLFSVSEALDIEENIWSPMFGLKGMIDVTLDANFRDNNSSKKVLLPMEIKTGKEYVEHQAQSALYSLLFKDRYNIDVLQFLLVYTKEGMSKKYDINLQDLKTLMNLRNTLTHFLKSESHELPELQRLSVCDTCDVQAPCMTINKLLENGTADESGINPELYDQLTTHLDRKEHYQDFYKHWDYLITKEESLLFKVKKDLWMMTSKEREACQGNALGNLVIVSADDSKDEQRQFKYTLTRNGTNMTPFTSSALSKFDKVIISDESGRFAISQGIVILLRENMITITTSRRIVNTDFRSNAFNGGNSAIRSVLHHTQNSSSQTAMTYRIDKDEIFYGMGLARYNILDLFIPGGAEKNRRLIVDGEAPTFTSKQPFDVENENFNPDQKIAFRKVMDSDDYSLILGMPGTGKTTLIAQIIKWIVEQRKTVLLTSYTHSAVDNILLKVKDFGIDIIRVGYPSRVHKDIRQFIPDHDEGKQINTYQDFCNCYLDTPVVAATCLGINDFTFSVRKKFDYCIVDEASQVSMPVSLGPIALASKFLLVGDHNQLPPLVTHPSAEVKKGLSLSLFKMLADLYPQSVAELTYQYRMCEDIMLLSNVLVYNFRLKCGSEKVAKQSLYIPHPEKIDFQISSQYDFKLKESELWMNLVFNPENKVLFLNHDNLPALEKVIGEKVENPTEVELVRQMVESLTLCGVPESSIGVMSLYRHHLKSLKRVLISKPDVEVLTADQFQGRDKDCVIISLVRSNNEKRVGDLLKEWRRVNVAITRSRSKLILLGSKSTLYNSDTLKGFIDLLNDRKWVHDLPKDANMFYQFAFQSPETQTTGSMRSSNLKSSSLNPDSKLVNHNPVLRDIVNDLTK